MAEIRVGEVALRRIVSYGGYALVRVGRGHHLAHAQGYAYEHRLVAEEKLGRRLLPDEHVHHLNHDKLDNRPENLEVCANNAAHRHEHHGRDGNRAPGEPNPVVSCACGCGAQFEKYDRKGRPRAYRHGCGRWRHAS